MLGITKSVADRMDEFSDPVRLRLQPLLAAQGLQYPPSAMCLIALKQERVMELWLADEQSRFKKIQQYPILGASGVLGPKLQEGDCQVPEGIYAVESLNPNSRFHLSLRLNYPNDFDRARGKEDKRIDLGSDIMIHGNTASIGCLAMGDAVAEELFVLAATVGCEHITVICAPCDLRQHAGTPVVNAAPVWYAELCAEIKKALVPFRLQ